MSTSNTRQNGAAPPSDPALLPQNQNTYFNQQRALLVNEIAAALDTTLTHLNRLNRSLESVIAVGNEFSSVEALWSQIEGVMGDREGGKKEDASSERGEGQEDDGSDMGEEPTRR